MTTPITSQDATPPSAPGTLSATGGLGAGGPDVGRRDRQQRRRPVQRPPLDDRRLHAQRRRTASRSPPARRTRTRAWRPGTYYYKVTAEDAAGNVGPASNEANGHGGGRHDAADGADGPHRDGAAPVRSRLGWARVDRQRRHRALQRPPRDGRRLHAERREPHRPADGTSYTDTGLAAGTYYYRVIAEDPSGNASPPSNEATATVSAAPPSGLVAAYSMDQGSGTSLPDLSGTRQQRHDQRRDVVDERQVRKRPQLQRRQQHRHRPRLELARPHDGDDARGVGAADLPRREVAHGAPQGAVGRHGLRPVRARRRRARRSRSARSSSAARGRPRARPR